MLPQQLFAIILYNSWHYGRIFHDNQNDNMDNNKAAFLKYFLYY